MSIQSNLYPPVMQTYLPACDMNGESFKIYFSISDFNNLENIGITQVSITNQKTNKSIFINDSIASIIQSTMSSFDETLTQEEKYTMIKTVAGLTPATVSNDICLNSSIILDDTITNDYKYYIEIPRSICKQIDINTYYKVQLRFTDSSLSLPSVKEAPAWLTENVQYFSEWSTVCLIRFIEYPTLDINGYDNFNSFELASEGLAIYQSRSTTIHGKIIYPNNEESDYLKHYKIQLLDSINLNVIEDSGILYPNNLNEIAYDFRYNFVEGNSYMVKISITTMSMYINDFYSKFIIMKSGSDSIDCTVTAIPEDELGRMKIVINGNNKTSFSGNYTIRRADSINNYATWSDFKTIFINQDNINIIDDIYDYTVESGVYYKYCIQKRRVDGSRGMTVESEPAMIYLDSMFINGNNRQLKMQYNTKISSSSVVVLENKVETLGYKYPFISRNADVKYRTLSITGLITVLNDIYGELGITHSLDSDHANASYKSKIEYLTPIDSKSLFTNQQEMFGIEHDRYADYMDNNNITLSINRIYEKIFREKVIEFLYNDNIKLIRTPDEGNIMVKLMNISLTPNSTLNGLIYDFTAQAVEVCDSNLYNYDYYDVQNIGDIKNQSVIHSRFGQEISVFKPNDGNIVNTIILDKYAGSYSNNYTSSAIGLSYLRIDFVSDPYFITGTKGVESTYRKMMTSPSSPGDSGEKPIAFGYLIKINGRVIIIPQSQSVYVLRGDDILVTSLEFLENTMAEINYEINIEEKEIIPANTIISNHYKIGQLWGVFEPFANQRVNVAYKCTVYNNIYYQSLLSINGIEVEGDEGIIIYVKESMDDTYYKHVMNNTNILSFYDEDTSIDDFYFGGRRFYRDLNDFDNIIPYNKFSYMGEYNLLTGSNVAIMPVENGLYYEIKSNKYFLYYKGEWHLAKLNTDSIESCEFIEVQVPVDAIVNVLFEVEKGVYQ